MAEIIAKGPVGKCDRCGHTCQCWEMNTLDSEIPEYVCVDCMDYSETDQFDQYVGANR